MSRHKLHDVNREEMRNGMTKGDRRQAVIEKYRDVSPQVVSRNTLVSPSARVLKI